MEGGTADHFSDKEADAQRMKNHTRGHRATKWESQLQVDSLHFCVY